jgi:Fe-S cluster biogenesis protein NfuA
MADVAQELVAQFDRMVRRDGGSLELVGADGGVIRVAYRMGSDPTCEGDACILPDAELQQLMSETLRRRDPALRVEVRMAGRAD